MRHSAIGARQAADKRARTVRLHNLPESTQEGLLQQALEKVIPVKRLEMFLSSREAIAELESQAVSHEFAIFLRKGDSKTRTLDCLYSVRSLSSLRERQSNLPLKAGEVLHRQSVDRTHNHLGHHPSRSRLVWLENQVLGRDVRHRLLTRPCPQYWPHRAVKTPVLEARTISEPWWH